MLAKNILIKPGILPLREYCQARAKRRYWMKMGKNIKNRNAQPIDIIWLVIVDNPIFFTKKYSMKRPRDRRTILILLIRTQ
jgi:hypothetical protein